MHHFIHARNGLLPEAVDLVEIFVIVDDRDAAVLLGNGDEGAEERGSEMLDEARGNILAEDGTYLLGVDGVEAVRLGGHRRGGKCHTVGQRKHRNVAFMPTKCRKTCAVRPRAHCQLLTSYRNHAGCWLFCEDIHRQAVSYAQN